MTDKVAGFIYIGLDEKQKDIVVNVPVTEHKDGMYHLVFSANQARMLARKLIKHADDLDRKNGLGGN